jgi:hypothetical protein
MAQGKHINQILCNILRNYSSIIHGIYNLLYLVLRTIINYFNTIMPFQLLAIL